MVHDSVREELASKITPAIKMPNKETVNAVSASVSPNHYLPKKPQTSELMIKNTSPTLVDFQNKNAALPDWRLQLQNSVRKRLDHQKGGDVEVIAPSPRRIETVTSGATALQTDAVADTETAPAVNPHVEAALKRIEESRKRYSTPETTQNTVSNTVKAFPLTFPSTHSDFFGEKTGFQPAVPYKQNLFQFSSEVKETKAEKFDTNKLPPLPVSAKLSSSFERRVSDLDGIDDIHETEADVVAFAEAEAFETVEEFEEFEDFAPLSMRFNAGLFDLLIGSFLSFVLLSPFMLLNGRFFSLEGFFAFLATCSIVMFIYLTTTVGLLGKTFGMKLFSLTIVDVEINDFPTLHQAAVSSSVYLLSLALGGIGFLTLLLNSESRAAHDLLSGTIIVRD